MKEKQWLEDTLKPKSFELQITFCKILVCSTFFFTWMPRETEGGGGAKQQEILGMHISGLS